MTQNDATHPDDTGYATYHPPLAAPTITSKIAFQLVPSEAELATDPLMLDSKADTEMSLVTTFPLLRPQCVLLLGGKNVTPDISECCRTKKLMPLLLF
jgi:hypothetical protein